jgi:hypothetical protein
VEPPNSSVRGGPGAAVDVEEEEEDEGEDGDEDERHVREGLRRLECGNSEEADICAQGNSSTGRGGCQHQSDRGDARPERLTGNSGMDVDRGRVGDVDGAGVAPQVEPSGSAGKGNENSSAMDVDADEVGLAARGEQSGAAGVGMGVASMNERDKAPSEATPESHPSKMPPPSNGKSSPVTGEKRKNPTRETKRKQTDELPSPRPKPRPRPRPKPKPGPKIHP